MIFVGNFVANFVEREHLAIHSACDEVSDKVRDEGMGEKGDGSLRRIPGQILRCTEV